MGKYELTQTQKEADWKVDEAGITTNTKKPRRTQRAYDKRKLFNS